MIPFPQRFEALVALGKQLSDICRNQSAGHDHEIQRLAQQLHVRNPWFVEPFVHKALVSWADRLSSLSLQELRGKYPAIKDACQQSHVAVLPEGNVPFAGLSDLVCILLAGYHFHGNNQNQQMDDLRFIVDRLISLVPDFSELIHWNGTPKEINTYLVHAKAGKEKAFNTYFEARHSLIRQKRISLAVVADTDNNDDFKQLADDIFMFFGLSPYNVRKLLVPRTFSLDRFFGSLEHYAWLYQHNRYANNYDYHKSVFLMDRIPFYDNGFLVLRESVELLVPPGCLYYEYYNDPNDLMQRLSNLQTNLQQVVTNLPGIPGAVKPGKAHAYSFWDFEDRKDILEFLLGV